MFHIQLEKFQDSYFPKSHDFILPLTVNIETSINVFDDTQYEKIIFDLFKAHQDIDGIFASSDVMAAY
ncbi:MAG: hypothetical protein WBH95_08580, partial [Caldicoprobacterales bacterium]